MENPVARIAYYRVSTGDQSVEAQRQVLGGRFDREFSDEGVSGSVLAANRPGFSDLLSYVREGDTVSVWTGWAVMPLTSKAPFGAFWKRA
jgi:putative DNA-invertase from lambdoid prophage Rac